MRLNPSQFHPSNIIDTCSIWNVLSSLRFYSAAKAANCNFFCTKFVYYECLHKPRKEISDEEGELIKRLKVQIENKDFQSFNISIEDLQDIGILEKRKNLSKGELSSIVFAKKTRQAFLTDDQGARILAEQFMDGNLVQTTPLLFGWLFFTGKLIDSDKDFIIQEHNSLNRPLEKYFIKMYEKAYELKLSQQFN